MSRTCPKTAASASLSRIVLLCAVRHQRNPSRRRREHRLRPRHGLRRAAKFTANGSAAQWLTLADPANNIAASVHCYLDSGNLSPTAIVDACSAFVSWARSNGAKVNIAEIAINAGPNGRATTCSSLAAAQAQWTNWTAFCAANNDVLAGWNWWGNSEAGWWNQGDSCDPEGYHWGLTLDDGVTQTVYMDLIEASIPVPILYIRDSLADAGAEPDLSVAVAWESPDVWVRQTADGVIADEPILGGSPAVIYVSVTNRGAAPYNGDGNDQIRVLWAKASAGLSRLAQRPLFTAFGTPAQDQAVRAIRRRPRQPGLPPGPDRSDPGMVRPLPGAGSSPAVMLRRVNTFASQTAIPVSSAHPAPP